MFPPTLYPHPLPTPSVWGCLQLAFDCSNLLSSLGEEQARIFSARLVFSFLLLLMFKGLQKQCSL